MIALLLALACGRTDPALAADRVALDASAAAERALSEGHPDVAIQELDRALAARPGDPVLRAWRAKALADAGQLDAAVAEAADVLAATPGFAVVRYDRAAWLARSGHTDAAAIELRRALGDGAARPRDVLTDPDFAPHLGDPAFDFLPRTPLVVALDAPEASLFWGSEARLRLRVAGAAGDAPIAIDGTVTGPVAVGSPVEELRQGADGVVHELSWPVRALGAGEAVVGPLIVRAGSAEATVEAARFTCTAPPGKEQAPSAEPAVLRVPSAIAGGWTTPSVHREGDMVWARVDASDRVALTPDPGPPSERMELREGGKTTFLLLGWRGLPDATTARVVRAGATVLEGPPE